MDFFKKLFESKENKITKKLLVLEEEEIKKGFYTLELDYFDIEGKSCKAKYQIVDGEPQLNMAFYELEYVGLVSEYSSLTIKQLDDEISILYNGKKKKLNKELVKQLMFRCESILRSYQEDQESRYRQFIKELVAGNYVPTEKTIGSEGIEEGKEITLTTDQGINLIFTREARGLVIKVKDSDQLYLRSLEYSMDKEAFTTAKVRKLNITTDEKEQLINFIKGYLDSSDVTMLFTEEELLMAKINA